MEADESTFSDEAECSEDWPYCECNNGTTEEEESDNVCDSCGKTLC